ncbi:hypothetical protein [Microvirga arsenatis]|uniref:Uncharacterized protein n=2 Tax=Microvirga arsenatis TaxID=2692265 RepID=A0ABW9YRZ0_9HYPH|nr:hypothetical protein [Microvirga arsenatis]NBJ09981.1 hypothetical protein [Microvirga arsenatis]NBJ23049.1 hypothetical protein [Microvirga arsenatis]
MLKRACLFLIAFLAATVSLSAQVLDPPEREDWCRHAERYLVRSNGQPFSCTTARFSRCLRMNNYGCLKQPGREPYSGTTFMTRRGARDSAGHAIFDHPKWSIVAMMNVYRRYAEQLGARSALQIAEIYSPWCDTLGSLPRKSDGAGNIWRPSCRGSAQASGSFVCRKPPPGQAPSARQCQACNCPSLVAAQMTRGTSFGPQEPLDLFDGNERPTELLLKVIANKMLQEQGVRPTPSLLEEAASSYRVQRWWQRS